MTGSMLLVVGLGAIFVALALALATVGAITSERRQVGRSLAAVQAISGPRPHPCATSSTARSASGSSTPSWRASRGSDGGSPATRPGRPASGTGSTLAGNPPQLGRRPGPRAARCSASSSALLVGVALRCVLGAGVADDLGVAVAARRRSATSRPTCVVYQLGYDRTEQMRRELPDALDLLTISVEAGLAFDAALSQVARNTDGPLAEEFFRVLQEMQIGLGRAEAMRALGERTDLPELRGFVTAMVQADAFGIPIANVLRVQAKEHAHQAVASGPRSWRRRCRSRSCSR